MFQELFAICLMLVGIPFGRWWISHRFGILDKPGPDVPKRSRVPTLQGLGSILAVLLVTFLFRPEFLWTESVYGLRIGLFLLVSVNFIDELGRLVHPRYRLSPVVKFILQGVSALCALRISGVGFTEIEIGGTMISFGWILSIVLTLGWFGLCTNAINRFDGVYGLASGSSAIGFVTIASLLTRVVVPLYPDMSVAAHETLQIAIWYAWLFAGVTIIATVMEFRPLGLMREVGTMSFGFAIAYLSLLGGAKIGTVVVVMALPLFDAVWVIVDRWLVRKVTPFKGDFTHLHYRLMALGWSRNEVRIVLWSLSIFFAILMLLQGGERRDKAIIFFLIALIFFLINGYLFWIKKLPKAYLPGEKTDEDLEKNYLP